MTQPFDQLNAIRELDLMFSGEALAKAPGEPLNMRILDVEEFIKQNNVGEVTSAFIKLPSENEFHPEGVFSETIFGQVASTDRLSKFGYINLHTEVFHPRVFKIISKLKSFYTDIIAGKTKAVFNERSGEFVRVTEENELGRTGFQFFISNFPKMQFKITKSQNRNDKVNILKQTIKDDTYKISKHLIIPAGVRDYKDEYGASATDEINKFYMALINYSMAMPPNKSTNPAFDPVRFSIQKKVMQIHDYLFDMLEGKSGFVQRKYGRRGLALGTRNVLSAASMKAKDPSDPQFLKSDETKVPLFEAMKAFQPIVANKLRMYFFDQIFDEASDQIGVIDPESYKLIYQPVSTDEKEKFITSTGLENMINLYRAEENRHDPVQVYNAEGNAWYLFMVYDEGNKIYHIRNVDAFKQQLLDQNRQLDETKLRPLTWIELMYVATFNATVGKHVFVTRYPVIGVDGSFPARVHLMSTSPSRTIQFVSPLEEQTAVELPEYPIHNAPSIDSVVIHPCRLQGLGGDYDGDTVSVNGVLSKDANDEIRQYLRSKGAAIGPSGDLRLDISGSGADLIALSLFNLSRPNK